MDSNVRLLGQWLKVSMFSLFLLCVMAACGPGNGTGNQPSSLLTPTDTATGTAFKVTSVDMSVNPPTIAGQSCGTNLTVTYTATFHVTPNSPGGTVNFLYTVNNGRSTPSASLAFAASETTKTYSFNWSGSLPADHTYPGLGGVVVTSPNQLTSSTLKPAGSCTTQDATFNVSSIDMSVNPTSIQGKACGTYLTVTYTATFHVTPNSPGGVVQFEYTVNNGRGSSEGSLTFGPGETTKTFTFTWAGNLPADHVYPEGGGADSTSPNVVNSQLVAPTGQCS